VKLEVNNLEDVVSETEEFCKDQNYGTENYVTYTIRAN